uniref:Uncharacterized protein n=1 Tax=Schistosoma japonicum TaxID=6182 RepID=Q5C0T0_SCHJA|nr:unknown [Schistosoma japonicum]
MTIGSILRVICMHNINMKVLVIIKQMVVILLSN